MGTIIHKVTSISVDSDDDDEIVNKILTDSGLRFCRFDLRMNGHVQFVIPSSGSKRGYETYEQYEADLKHAIDMIKSYCRIEIGMVEYGHDLYLNEI